MSSLTGILSRLFYYSIKDNQLTSRAGILFALFVALSGISTDLYFPALPTIARDFALTQTQSQWLISTYLLGFALSILPCAYLSERFGKRNVLLIGTALHVITSLSFCFVHSYENFLLLRFVHGFGGATLSIISRAMARELYSGKESVRAFAYIFIGSACGATISPLIGSWLCGTCGWRATALFSMLFGIIVLLLAQRWLPHNRSNETRPSLRSQLRLVLNCGDYIRYTGCLLTLWLGFFAFAVKASFLFIEQLKVSVHQFGFLYLAIVSGMVFGSLFAKSMAKRYCSLQVLQFGIWVALFGASAFLLLPLFFGHTITFISLPIGIYLIGVGIAAPCCQNAATEPLKEHASMSFSVMYFAQMFSCSMLGAIVGYWRNTETLAMMMLGCALASFVILHLPVSSNASDAT